MDAGLLHRGSNHGEGQGPTPQEVFGAPRWKGLHAMLSLFLTLTLSLSLSLSLLCVHTHTYYIYVYISRCC